MTPLSGVLYDTGSATHAGRVRQQNEDNFIVSPHMGLWAVADGMGGHEAGGLASAAVVDALGQLKDPIGAAELLQDCERVVRDANQSIRVLAAERGFEVMGTTLVLLLLAGRHFACLWAGDSRIYRLRGASVEQLTRDHSEAQELVDQGVLTPEDAKSWPRRNVITRAIGVFEEVDLDLAQGEVEPGDTFILCSDGLTGHVEAEEFASHIENLRAQEASDALVALTLERGAKDNVTVVVVRCRKQTDTVVFPVDRGNGAVEL